MRTEPPCGHTDRASLRAPGTGRPSLLPGAPCPLPLRPRRARAGQRQRRSAAKGRGSLPARGCPEGLPQPRPAAPRTHTGHPAVLRARRRSGAGRPPAGPRQRRLQRGGKGREGQDPPAAAPPSASPTRRTEIGAGRPGPESRGRGREGAQQCLAGHGGAGMFLPGFSPCSALRASPQTSAPVRAAPASRRRGGTEGAAHS